MSSPAPVLETLDWRPVAETLAALQAECAQSEELIEDLFSELEKRRAELAQKAAEVEQHRQDAGLRRRELEQEREKWGKSLQERLAASPLAGDSGGAPRQASDLELERAALVAELEQVRARAAELHETLLEQQQEHAEQNARLAGEIQSLRQWIERNAEMRDTSSRESAVELQELDNASSGIPAPAGGADPVVSSVMAQFAQLQRDVAKRRKRK
jgi:chromosome segregation ATPase